MLPDHLRLLTIFTWGFTNSFGFLVPCSLFSSLSVATDVCSLFHWVSYLWPLNVIVYYVFAMGVLFCLDRFCIRILHKTWQCVLKYYSYLHSMWQVALCSVLCLFIILIDGMCFVSKYLSFVGLLYTYDLDALSVHYLSMRNSHFIFSVDSPCEEFSVQIFVYTYFCLM